MTKPLAEALKEELKGVVAPPPHPPPTTPPPAPPPPPSSRPPKPPPPVASVGVQAAGDVDAAAVYAGGRG